MSTYKILYYLLLHKVDQQLVPAIPLPIFLSWFSDCKQKCADLCVSFRIWFCSFHTKPLNTEESTSIVEYHRDAPPFQYFHPGSPGEAACKQDMRVWFCIHVAEGANGQLSVNNPLLYKKIASFKFL